MRERHKTGSVVFDKDRRTWRFMQWVDGKRKSQTIGTKQQYPTKAAAWKAAKELPIEAVTAVDAVPTVNQLIEQYRAERMPKRYSTRRSYDAWLRNHVIPKWGTREITAVQPRPAELWLLSLPLTPRSRAAVRSMLGHLWDYAMWRGEVATQRNPMELVKIEGASKRTSKPHSLTVKEFQDFIIHLEEPFTTIALVCVCFGLRISEALALKWSDVDWLQSALKIERAIVRQHVDTTKTETSHKAVAISKPMLQTLRTWKQTTKFSAPEDWIFASPSALGALPWSADAVNDAYLRATRAAGIPHISTHSMRHTYRSWLAAVGTPIDVQQKLMRHADVRTTMNTYGDVITNEMAEACGKVSKLAIIGSRDPFGAN